MIIPVRCFTCGKVLANKYRYYRDKVRQKKLDGRGGMRDTSDVNKVTYFTQEFQDKTPEGEVLDELKLTKMCCRRHLLTHVDIP